MKPDVISLKPCGTKFEHRKDAWCTTLPLSRLTSWINFYRRLAKKKPQFYRASVEALEAFARTLNEARK